MVTAERSAPKKQERYILGNPVVQVLIVGSGKLAAELIENLKSPNIASVLPGAEEMKCLRVKTSWFMPAQDAN